MSLSRITSASIANSAISAADIADGTITAAKIISVANTQITGNIVSSQIAPSIVLTTPALGTPASGVLTNCTGVAAAALPSGSVLQVVQGSTDSQLAITSATYTDITGLSASITPRSASNKILVLYRINGATSGATLWSAFQIVRNSTAVGNGAQGTLRTKAHSAERGQFSDGNPYWSTSGEFLDSPSTTSAVTYKIQTSSNGTTYVNRAATNGDIADYVSTLCSITLMEIQG
jgi:hypothetical protein